MHSIVTHDPEETPTKPGADVQSRVLVALTRVDRLAELASEKLMVAPDDDALVSALEDLAAIRRLAGAVIR